MNRYIKTFENFSIETEFPEFWYHGTNKLFDTFTLDNLGKNYQQSTLGIYFSQYLNQVYMDPLQKNMQKT